MNAVALGFPDGQFDVTICVQNGISAFKEDQETLVAEAVRVTRRQGLVLFSSYSERFWEPRLEWFEIQARHGLLGEIDRMKTRDGVIVCKDGFVATTVGRASFEKLVAPLNLVPAFTEVDSSTLFCVIRAR
jgi:2-polyprenyl-6-hydroxyphenyl methylase/3-demethylubiquinone-9 3-methyltransferase